MRRAAIVSSVLFTTAIVGVFAFPNVLDVVSGRTYQLLNFIDKASARVSLASVYEAFDQEKKYVGVIEGMRKEEIADLCEKKLSWTKDEAEAFSSGLACSVQNNDEGYYLPGSYIVDKNSSPKDVKLEMKERFEEALRQKVEELEIGRAHV